MGLFKDNGKYNGNYYSILGLFKDNGNYNGNYYSILGLDMFEVETRQSSFHKPSHFDGEML